YRGSLTSRSYSATVKRRRVYGGWLPEASSRASSPHYTHVRSLHFDVTIAWVGYNGVPLEIRRREPMKEEKVSEQQSEPVYDVQRQRDVPAPMRDGTRLRADVYL